MYTGYYYYYNSGVMHVCVCVCVCEVYVYTYTYKCVCAHLCDRAWWWWWWVCLCVWCLSVCVGGGRCLHMCMHTHMHLSMQSYHAFASISITKLFHYNISLLIYSLGLTSNLSFLPKLLPWTYLQCDLAKEKEQKSMMTTPTWLILHIHHVTFPTVPCYPV